MAEDFQGEAGSIYGGKEACVAGSDEGGGARLGCVLPLRGQY